MWIGIGSVQGLHARTIFHAYADVDGSRHALSDVQQRILDRGGRIDPRVSLKTDFVVALSDAEEGFEVQIELATTLGVVFMREEELLEYLGLD